MFIAYSTLNTFINLFIYLFIYLFFEGRRLESCYRLLLFPLSKFLLLLTPSMEIEPGPHWWEASALTTALQKMTFNGFIKLIQYLKQFADIVQSICI